MTKEEKFLHDKDIYQSEVPLFRVKELLSEYLTEQTLSLKYEHAIEILKIYQDCNKETQELLKQISQLKTK